VLIIMTDDQRDSGTLSRMPATRHWFQEEGVRYLNGFTPIPVCCPARASVMTGQYSHNHGVKTNQKGASGVAALDPETTIQRYLQGAGYRTGIFGKYLNRWDLEVDPPHFDAWTIFNSGYSDTLFNVQGDVKQIATYSTRFVAEEAVRFLQGSELEDTTPWMMYVTPYAPHWPARPEEAYADAPVGKWGGNPAVLEQNRKDKPPYIQERSANESLAKARQRRARQLRTLMSVDDLVKSLRRTLGKLGENDNTLAFFLSDNGVLWGEHGWYSKNVPYTAALEVPLFLRWPAAALVPGSNDGRLISLVDLAPTVFDATGIEPDHAVDGRSLLDAGWKRPRSWAQFWGRKSQKGASIPPWGSLRTPAYQYVEYYDQGGQVIFREYYDLATDPWQLKNLLGDGDSGNDPPPGELDQLSEEVERGGTCVGTEGPKACP
jgi:arylsulfatase A-like enzyme